MGPEAEIDWDAFFKRYGPLALRFARGLVGGIEATQDLAQEAARMVIERKSSFASEEHARNFLFRAMRNAAIDGMRTRRAALSLEDAEQADRREATPFEASAEADERASADLRLRRVQNELQRLRAEEREALGLRFGEGLGYREMSARTGQAISTLKDRVDAALVKLRSRVSKLEVLP